MVPKLRVVWLIEARFEREWLMMLLSNPAEWEIEEVEEDPERLQHLQTVAQVPLHPPGTLFIFNRSILYERYFARYQQAGVPFAAIHLSDEFYHDTFHFYRYPTCQWVARNYWHPQLAEVGKVFTFGLGWKNGFQSVECAPAPDWKDRPHTVSFAGNVHHEMRRDFVAAFDDLPTKKMHLTFDGFNSTKGLNLAEYRGLMNQSQYVICPIGHFNIDCFRVYEALEAGAVPITVMWTPAQRWTYWNALFQVDGGGIPWIQAGTAAACRSELDKRLLDPEAAQARAAACRMLWQAAKVKWSGYFHQGIRRLLDVRSAAA